VGATAQRAPHQEKVGRLFLEGQVYGPALTGTFGWSVRGSIGTVGQGVAQGHRHLIRKEAVGRARYRWDAGFGPISCHNWSPKCQNLPKLPVLESSARIEDLVDLTAKLSYPSTAGSDNRVWEGLGGQNRWGTESHRERGVLAG